MKFINNNCLLFPIFVLLSFHFIDGENLKCIHSKKEITDKLLYLIKDPVEVSQIIHFLNQQEEIYGSFQASPSWTNLCNVYSVDEIFGNVAHLLTTAKEDKINEHVEKLYEAFHLVLINPKNSLPADLKFSDLLAGSAQSMDKILQSLSPSLKAKILSQLPNIGALQTVGTNMIVSSEFLTGVYLSWETYYNIYRWWNGEISGTRAAKNIFDSIGTVMGGSAGAYAGGTIGSMFGPVGTVFGAGIGGIYGSLTAAHYSESFTRWFFDLPKSEALDAAYNALGVHHTASNHEINKAFRSLVMKYHPDKPEGSHEKFMELQYFMAIIKAARGEGHNY